jgi:cysteinyl-tRNA synthetase
MTSAMLTSPPRPLRLGDRLVPAVGRVRMYVCGITPYDVTHLGHAATFIWADAADKVLSWAGHTVSVARNVTDVDDVLYAEARRRGQDATLFGALQRASFEATMGALRVRTPDLQPTAAQAIGHVVQLGATLLANGRAYLRNGTVYARTAAAAGEAGIDEARALELAAEYHDRPDDPDKEHPLDMVVWRTATTGEHREVSWPSPWGPGRPGWHAECAAMVLALYGPSVDLHCGGADLKYPHHAGEAALAEAATGVTPFARTWLRAGIVEFDGQKMSKSLGNLVLVDELLAEHTPATVRMLCLNRAPGEAWSYTPQLLDAAAGTLDALYTAAGTAGGAAGPDELADALLDGLDVARAVEIALAEGGAAARALIDVLALG